MTVTGPSLEIGCADNPQLSVAVAIPNAESICVNVGLQPKATVVPVAVVRVTVIPAIPRAPVIKKE